MVCFFKNGVLDLWRIVCTQPQWVCSFSPVIFVGRDAIATHAPQCFHCGTRVGLLVVRLVGFNAGSGIGVDGHRFILWPTPIGAAFAGSLACFWNGPTVSTAQLCRLMTGACRLCGINPRCGYVSSVIAMGNDVSGGKTAITHALTEDT